MITLPQVVKVLAGISSVVAIGFGIFHHLTVNDPFVMISSVVYVGVLWGLPRVHSNRHYTCLLQLFLMANMFFNGFGTFSYYRTSYYYDDVVHFISPALLAYAGVIWRGIQGKSIWPAVVFAVVIAVGWEPMEVFMDRTFGTHTYGQTDQANDTIYDIIMDLLGVLSATLLYLLHRRKLLRWLQS